MCVCVCMCVYVCMYVCITYERVYVCMYTSEHIYCTYIHTHTHTHTHSKLEHCLRDFAPITKITLRTFVNCVVTEAHSREGYGTSLKEKNIHVNNSYISDVVYQLLLRRFIPESSDERDTLWGLYSRNTAQN